MASDNNTVATPHIEVDKFIIHPFTFNRETGIAEFHYSFDNTVSFTEFIDFGMSCNALSEKRYAALLHCLSYAQIAAGISYYKACIPSVIKIEDLAFDEECAAFFMQFYTHGLGEFAYRNGLNLKDHIRFVYDKTSVSPHHVNLQHHAAVLFGGGKDSIVCAEILKHSNMPISLFAVNPAQEITDGMKVAGQDEIIIRRSLDKGLFELNEQGAYNGHVPITGILTFIAVCASLIYDYDAVVLSNERSANEGNVIVDGVSVNHQYSKSFEFEQEMHKFVHEKMLHQIKYFSLLRPMSELHIAQQFLQIDSYDEVFTSCNANFRIHDKLADKRWCNNCPKCRFAFLILAASLPKQRVLKIFGANLLDDPRQEDGFSELLGLLSHKPWECVGEIMESRLALWLIAKKDEWESDALVQKLVPQLSEFTDELKAQKESYFTLTKEHLIPREYLEALHAFVD